MFYVSEIQKVAPVEFKTNLQKRVYQTLGRLEIPFERVNTDVAVTMEDCLAINKRLSMKMVKTLFLCNRQQTDYYLFVTVGEKPFRAKEFSTALGVSRVSFAPVEKMNTLLQTEIGAATVFSGLITDHETIRIVFDKEVVSEAWYGCSDGTTTGYMKVATEDIVNKFLGSVGYRPLIVEV
jgi:Ala-tRNA(Pro) deacylase